MALPGMRRGPGQEHHAKEVVPVEAHGLGVAEEDSAARRGDDRRAGVVAASEWEEDMRREVVEGLRRRPEEDEGEAGRSLFVVEDNDREERPREARIAVEDREVVGSHVEEEELLLEVDIRKEVVLFREWNPYKVSWFVTIGAFILPRNRGGTSSADRACRERLGSGPLEGERGVGGKKTKY